MSILKSLCQYVPRKRLNTISYASASVVASCMDDNHVFHFYAGCVTWDETVNWVWLSTAFVSCEALALWFFCTFLSKNQSSQDGNSQRQLEPFKELDTSPYFWISLSLFCPEFITVILYSFSNLVIFFQVFKWCHCFQPKAWELFSRFYTIF